MAILPSFRGGCPKSNLRESHRRSAVSFSGALSRPAGRTKISLLLLGCGLRLFDEQSTAQSADDCSDCDARDESVTNLQTEQFSRNSSQACGQQAC